MRITRERKNPYTCIRIHRMERYMQLLFAIPTNWRCAVIGRHHANFALQLCCSSQHAVSFPLNALCNILLFGSSRIPYREREIALLCNQLEDRGTQWVRHMMLDSVSDRNAISCSTMEPPLCIPVKSREKNMLHCVYNLRFAKSWNKTI